MKQFSVLFRKECLASWRDFKWIWMPLVFIILGLTEPLTVYYMPVILDSVGNLPEGTIIEIPTPRPEEVLVSSIGQFNMIGVLIVVLAFMASLAGERKTGAAGMVLVKPVSYFSYIMSKWLSALFLVWISYFSGMLASWYYTSQLFEMVDIRLVLSGFFIYGLWLTLIVTFAIFFGTFASTSGVVAFLTLGVTIILSFVSSMLSERLLWSPAQLLKYTSELLLQHSIPDDIFQTTIVTIFLIVALVLAALLIFRRKELA